MSHYDEQYEASATKEKNIMKKFFKSQYEVVVEELTSIRLEIERLKLEVKGMKAEENKQ